MDRFLLVLAAITAYSSVYSEKFKPFDGITRAFQDIGKPCPDRQYFLRGYHGDYKAYYSNGNVSEKGTYNLGELHGVVEKCNEDGSLYSRDNFAMGSRQGKAELFVKGSNQSNSSLMEA